jgi:CHAT domain-containing protein
MISNRESPTDGNGCIIAVPEDREIKDREIRETGKEIGKLRKQRDFQDIFLSSEEGIKKLCKQKDFQDTFLSDLSEEEIKELCEQKDFQDTFLSSVKIATLEAVRSRLREAKFIHFAGHGKFEENLQSALLLAGNEKLKAIDLFQLRLPNPRFVMLGACETAQIQDSPTDEYMGLSSGFLFAGAHNVLATLWRVHAGATRSFVDKFYLRFLDSKNPPLIEVLQESQKELSRVQGREHPYYWGAFVLIGEGK